MSFAMPAAITSSTSASLLPAPCLGGFEAGDARDLGHEDGLAFGIETLGVISILHRHVLNVAPRGLVLDLVHAGIFGNATCLPHCFEGHVLVGAEVELIVAVHGEAKGLADGGVLTM